MWNVDIELYIFDSRKWNPYIFSGGSYEVEGVYVRVNRGLLIGDFTVPARAAAACLWQNRLTQFRRGLTFSILSTPRFSPIKTIEISTLYAMIGFSLEAGRSPHWRPWGGGGEEGL